MNKRKLYFWIHNAEKHDNCHYCGEPGVITYIDLDDDTISLCKQCDDKKDEQFFKATLFKVTR